MMRCETSFYSDHIAPICKEHITHISYQLQSNNSHTHNPIDGGGGFLNECFIIKIVSAIYNCYGMGINNQMPLVSNCTVSISLFNAAY